MSEYSETGKSRQSYILELVNNNDLQKILCCGSKSDQEDSAQEIDDESQEKLIKQPGVVKIYRDVSKDTTQL